MFAWMQCGLTLDLRVIYLPTADLATICFLTQQFEADNLCGSVASQSSMRYFSVAATKKCLCVTAIGSALDGLHVYLRQPDGLFSKKYEWDLGTEDALRLLL